MYRGRQEIWRQASRGRRVAAHQPRNHLAASCSQATLAPYRVGSVRALPECRASHIWSPTLEGQAARLLARASPAIHPRFQSTQRLHCPPPPNGTSALAKKPIDLASTVTTGAANMIPMPVVPIACATVAMPAVHYRDVLGELLIFVLTGPVSYVMQDLSQFALSLQ
jgi:hypothetical protein